VRPRSRADAGGPATWKLVPVADDARLALGAVSLQSLGLEILEAPRAAPATAGFSRSVSHVREGAASGESAEKAGALILPERVIQAGRRPSLIRSAGETSRSE